MGIKSFSQDQCVAGCRICIDDCPTDVFATDERNGKATVAYPEDCWECLICEKECPGKAIRITPAAVRKIWYPF